MLHVSPDSQVNPSSTIPRPDVDHTTRQARPIRTRLRSVQLKQPDGNVQHPHLIEGERAVKLSGLRTGFLLY